MIENVQVEALVPDGVQFLGHGSCTFLDLSNLARDIRIRRTAFIFGD